MSGRVVITADQVQAAAATGCLEVPAGALVTPLARDLAADLGVALVEPGRVSTAPVTGDLQDRVRDVVARILAEAEPKPAAPRHPVKLCRGGDVATEPFPPPGPGPDQEVRAADVITESDGSPVATGYLTLTAGTFPWHMAYDEIQVVLEGELHIGTPEGVKIGRPGDVLYIPKGSDITFGTPSWARFVYVTHPANWEAEL